MDWQERNQQVLERGMSIIRRVPFIRAIYLTGSIAENRANQSSDIDLFIQVVPDHLWSTRFFVTILIILAGLYRTDHAIAGKLCLNWYATFPAPEQQKSRVYRLLWRETKEPTDVKRWLERSLSGRLGQAIEQWLKAYQVQRIERDPRTHLPGSHVRYSDQELGFHPPKSRKQAS